MSRIQVTGKRGDRSWVVGESWFQDVKFRCLEPLQNPLLFARLASILFIIRSDLMGAIT